MSDTYACNKCGYVGPERDHHTIKPCWYYAVEVTPPAPPQPETGERRPCRTCDLGYADDPNEVCTCGDPDPPPSPSEEPHDMLPESIASAIVDEWERIEGESMREGHRATMERLIAQVVRDRVGQEAVTESKQGGEGELERLADAQHEIWSHWMRWFFENDTPENRERWKRQMHTSYASLTEGERESDRRVVREFMAFLLPPVPQSEKENRE